MFSLISGFWSLLFAKPNINVLIIGLDHAGKTTTLERIKVSPSVFLLHSFQSIADIVLPPNSIGKAGQSEQHPNRKNPANNRHEFGKNTVLRQPSNHMGPGWTD